MYNYTQYIYNISLVKYYYCFGNKILCTLCRYMSYAFLVDSLRMSLFVTKGKFVVDRNMFNKMFNQLSSFSFVIRDFTEHVVLAYIVQLQYNVQHIYILLFISQQNCYSSKTLVSFCEEDLLKQQSVSVYKKIKNERYSSFLRKKMQLFNFLLNLKTTLNACVRLYKSKSTHSQKKNNQP